MHPLYMDRLVSERQRDLFEEAGTACGSTPRKSSARERRRRTLRRRRGEAHGDHAR